MKIEHKCRRCGDTFSKSGGGAECCALAVQIAMNDSMKYLWRGKIGLPPRMATLHRCKDGGYGVADLIGASPDTPNAQISGGTPSAESDCSQGRGCPHCDNQGWYMRADSESGEPVQEQCQWCYTVPDSKFNLANTKLNGASQHQRSGGDRGEERREQ